MKRMFSALLSAALLLSLLPACNSHEVSQPVKADAASPAPTASGPVELELNCSRIMDGIWTALAIGEVEMLHNVADDGQAERLATYIEGAYGLSGGEWEDAGIARATGASAIELAVLRFADEDGAKHGEEYLQDYLHRREGDFTGYAPDQAKLVADGALSRQGRYVGLFICEDSDLAQSAFEEIITTGELPDPRPVSTPEPTQDVVELPDQYGNGVSDQEWVDGSDPDGLTPIMEEEEVPAPSTEPAPVHSDRVQFTQPNKDDMSLYNTSAIRTAWASGDPSGLSDYDRETYDAAQEILGEILAGGMTDLEKETAIYSWLVDNVDYDWTHQDVMVSTPRASYEPYGGLVNRTAVCLGYATSFQLLMDLAGVECITVVGAAFSSEEDHGWNMVRLNGNWYCVDVTWDANFREQGAPSGPEDWRYFNVTSDRMALSNHQWDYANTPEATAADRGQG